MPLPEGFDPLRACELTDNDVRDLRNKDTPLSAAWATLRVGIRRINRVRAKGSIIDLHRAELDVLFDVLRDMGVSVGIEKEH